MADRGVKFQVDADTSKADAKMRAMDTAVGGMATGGIAKLGLAWTELRSKIMLIGDAMRLIGDVIAAPVNAAMEAEAVQLKLNAGLEAQGKLTEENKEKVDDYINTLSKKIAKDDEELAAIAAYGLAIGVRVDDIGLFVQAVVSYAEETDKSFEAAQVAIGSFATGAVDKIRMTNIEVDESTTGHERLVVAVSETEAGWISLMGKADTFTVKLDKLKIGWENVLEKLGNIITQSEPVRQVLDRLMGKIEDLAEYIERHPEMFDNLVNGIQDFSDTMLTLLDKYGDIEAFFVNLGNVLSWFGDAWNAAMDPLGTAWQGIQDLPGQVWDSAGGFFGGNIATDEEESGGMDFFRSGSSTRRGSSGAGGVNEDSLANRIGSAVAREMLKGGGNMRLAEVAGG